MYPTRSERGEREGPRDIPLPCTGSMMARARTHHRWSLHATKTSATCEGEKVGERHGHRRQREMLEEEGTGEREERA
jgi:hypothetical protein